MREIRIENVKDLVFEVVANKLKNDFLVGRELYEILKGKSATITENDGILMNFEAENANMIALKFEIFCKAFFRLERVTVNGNVIYGYSQCRNTGNQIVLEAK